MRRAIDLKIVAGFSEAELAIDRSPHNVGITVILAIILPPADRTQAVGIRKIESFITTAEAAHARKLLHKFSDAILTFKLRKIAGSRSVRYACSFYAPETCDL
jgi:hypothetical protein